jgi:hypothetical protein
MYGFEGTLIVDSEKVFDEAINGRKKSGGKRTNKRGVSSEDETNNCADDISDIQEPLVHELFGCIDVAGRNPNSSASHYAPTDSMM